MTKVIPWLIAAIVIAVAVRRRSQSRSSGKAETRLAPHRRSPVLPQMLQTDVALIAGREIRQRARSRLFKVVTALMLAGVSAAIVIPSLTEGGQAHRRVGVVGAVTSTDRSLILGSGRSVNTNVSIVTEPSETSADHDLLAGRVDLVLIATQRLVTKTELTNTDTSTTARLARTLGLALGELKTARDAGLTPAQTAALQSARSIPLAGLRAAPRRGAGRSAAVLGVILLFVLLTQYNTWTLLGVMEEKATRVVEVLLATVRPIQLLTGKVIGIGLLVLAQAGLLVATALAVAAAVGSDLLHGAGPATVINILVWLVLGYAFYSWVYAAAGSLAERQDQVQSIALPIALPMILGYVMALTVAGSGTPSTFFDVLAYLPPTAPFAMPVLVSLNDATWWQVLLSALISVGCTIGVARAAAVVYRRAVLRTGRRVRLRDVLGAPHRIHLGGGHGNDRLSS